MSDALAGGVFAASTGADEQAELRQLVDDIGRRSFEARIGQRSLPETFDVDAWQALEDTGLSRLTGTAELGAGPTEAAVVLRGLARHAVAVPVAETDLLAGWLAGTAGLALPDSGPLTVALGDADGTARDVPWTRACAAVVLAVRTGDGWRVSVARPEDLEITEGRNLAGEPRDTVRFGPVADAVEVGFDVGAELLRRGAWARCVQVIGALDAAAEMSVAHTRERVQFGRPLSKFQAVQHALARLAGEVERARAATTLAVAAAADHGFSSAQADYAVTVAKVVLGRVVPAVTTTAHQLHGAIGVTIEHQLWSATFRAHAWIGEFGSTGQHARHLGRRALAAADGGDGPLWDALTWAR
ncbi:acyl-CoA dehydrogenase family protein [[Mycobacterium] burgundiense]|uniref:Acyl-CoA dehydrogenase family protein n=1 Tax=[Mycobacterium] burgundiense TaxID=3064286 RepID=A0ABN9NSF6_9MYCO|nr:acyl-CoA dehydrogenase family protein [Mycolicibacterium sp. MU0053]CAJ1509920.1 acyl-CoA dehydrogenase family protein [Mycolicibacterium sp. MU0053]